MTHIPSKSKNKEIKEIARNSQLQQLKDNFCQWLLYIVLKSIKAVESEQYLSKVQENGGKM